MSPSQAAQELADKPLHTFERIGAVLDAAIVKHQQALAAEAEASAHLALAIQELSAAQKGMDDFTTSIKKMATFQTYWGGKR